MTEEAGAVSTYREVAPGPLLSRDILCLWVQRVSDGAAPFPHPVLPDGCIDLVWAGSAPVIAGPATRPVTVRLPRGSLVVGVRFRPGRAPGLLRESAAAFLDREVPLRDVWGRGVDEITARVAEAGTAGARLAVLARALTERMAGAAPPDPLVAEAVRRLASRPGGHVGDLARALGIGERQLRRRFVEAVGYGPKTLQRVLRLQRVLAAAAATPGARLADLAHEAGYADQAHMTRELADLAGASAARLLAATGGSTLAMSDLFKTAAPPPD